MWPPLSRIGAIAEDLPLTQAAIWHARLQDAEPSAHPAFTAWLEADPRHARAWASVNAAHQQAASLAEENPLLALRQQTLARTMLARPSAPQRYGRRQGMIAAGVLALVATPLAAFSIHTWNSRKAETPTVETFHTDVGQQADVTLSDGSLVTLDTNSRLVVRYEAGKRSMMLHGQGWFRIAPSATPWQIDAGGQSFSSTQGSFDLRTDPGQLRAYAHQGKLAMGDEDGSSLTLAPGRLLTQRGDDRLIRDLPDASGFTAWREGLLQFENVSLSDAVSEFNRYRHSPIKLADARVGTLRISGAFRTSESARFLDALSSGFPVNVQDKGQEGVLIRSR